MFDFVYAYKCTILIANIFNYLLLKIMKIIYFENTRRDKSNNISYTNICMYTLVEKYSQSRSNE
jgi:VanZ family protein